MRGSAPPQPAPTHAQTVSTDRSEGAVRAQLYARVSVVAECVAKAASVELGEEPNCSPASNISLERRNPHRNKLHPGSRRVRGSGAWAAFAVGGLVEVMHAYDKTLPSIDALDLAKRQLFPHFRGTSCREDCPDQRPKVYSGPPAVHLQLPRQHQRNVKNTQKMVECSVDFKVAGGVHPSTPCAQR